MYGLGDRTSMYAGYLADFFRCFEVFMRLLCSLYCAEKETNLLKRIRKCSLNSFIFQLLGKLLLDVYEEDLSSKLSSKMESREYYVKRK